MLVKVANSPRLLLLTGFIALVLAGIGYSLTEHASVGDSLYWSFITASTVGYGDMLPKTGASKIVSILLIAFALFFFVPMITASMASKLIVDRDAFTNEEQERLLTRMDQVLGLVDELDGDVDVPE